MCHAQLDPRLLMQDAEERYRAARPLSPSVDDRDAATIPPELIGGLRGVVARMMAQGARLLHRAQAAATG